jgi:hypothetical protein
VKEPEAREALELLRVAHNIDPGARLSLLERRYIEVGDAPPAVPSEVWDVLAWVGRFSIGSRWVEIAVDDTTGSVLRVRWSRGAPAPREDVDL